MYSNLIMSESDFVSKDNSLNSLFQALKHSQYHFCLRILFIPLVCGWPKHDVKYAIDFWLFVTFISSWYVLFIKCKILLTSRFHPAMRRDN